MRLLPRPALSAALALFWLVLAGRWTAGSLVLALALGLVLPLVLPAPRGPRPRLAPVPAYAAIVLWDVILGAFAVARVILFRRPEDIHSALVEVPLDLTDRGAIAILAGTITMTPGTLTADYTPDGRALVVHALHAPDPDALRDDIKTRYESRLKRIFG